MDGYPPVVHKVITFGDIPYGMVFYKSDDLRKGFGHINAYVKISDDSGLYLAYVNSTVSGGMVTFTPSTQVAPECMMDRDIYDQMTKSFR